MGSPRTLPPGRTPEEDRRAALRVAVQRTLWSAAGPLDYEQVRLDVRRQIRSATKHEVWRALRELADAGIVAADQEEDVREIHGFEEVIRFPVFRPARRPGPGGPVFRDWWHAFVVATASGREVSP